MARKYIWDPLIDANWRIYVSVNYTVIGLDSGLCHVYRQASIWTNNGFSYMQPLDQISVKFELNYENFHATNCIWKRRLPFIAGSLH